MKNYKTLSLLFILATVFIASCSSLPTEKPKEFALELHYELASKNQVLLSNTLDEEKLSFIFPVIPGNFFGNPTQTILASPAAKKGQFLLTLPVNSKEHAAPISQELLLSGATFSNPKTNIMRLGTFHYFSDKKGFGGGGFIDKISNEFLILVYFSNPIKIIGYASNLNNGDAINYKIDIDKEGWHWILSEEHRKGTYTLKNYSGDTKNII